MKKPLLNMPEYIDDTSAMKLAEIGGYTLLLRHQAKHGSIDESRIAYILGPECQEVWPAIAAFFETTENGLVIPWLAKKMKVSAARRQNARGSKEENKDLLQHLHKQKGEQMLQQKHEHLYKQKHEQMLQQNETGFDKQAILLPWPLQDLEKDLLDGFTLREGRIRQIKSETGYSFTPEEHDQHVAEFIETYKNTGLEQQSLLETRRHFLFSLRKKAKDIQQEKAKATKGNEHLMERIDYGNE